MDEIGEVIVLSHLEVEAPLKKIRNFEELIAVNPEYFVVASNTASHFRQLSFIEKNFSGKSILVEKPLFEKLYDLTIRKNSVFVGYNLRFHPIIRLIKEKIDSKELWNINIFCGSFLPEWRPGSDYRQSSSARKDFAGGVLLDLSHELDYVQWFCGKITPEHVSNKKISNLEIETDDFLFLSGKSESCSHINISLNYFTRKPIRNIIIDGDGISIQADLINNSVVIYEDDKPPNYFSWPELNRNSTYHAEHKAILSNKTTDICPYKQGLETMVLIDTIRQWQE